MSLVTGVCQTHSRRLTHSTHPYSHTHTHTHTTQTEVYEAKCEVVSGALPAQLDGVFMRNGSNPYYDPYAGYHWCVPSTQLHLCASLSCCRCC